MTIQDLGSLGELLAALATLATLGYLAVQVGQAKRQLEATQIQARSSFSTDTGRWAAEVQLRWFSPSGPNPVMMKALLTEERNGVASTRRVLGFAEGFEPLNIRFGVVANRLFDSLHHLVVRDRCFWLR